MNLFDIVPESFFKPLNSKYKEIYIDVLGIIYSSCKTEFSFSTDKDVIVEKLTYYFENKAFEEMEFEEIGDVSIEPKEKANAVIRTLIKCGWIEQEQFSDYTIKINLFDYSISMIETFSKIVKNDEVEYQSIISDIYNTLTSKEAYEKPYEFVIKSVSENTENLIIALKKLNTTIKKRIDNITKDKAPEEVVKDFFNYHKDVWSKAYHRIKTSDNISKFRVKIIDSLRNILDDPEIFEMSVKGFMEIEDVADYNDATEELTEKIHYIISAFINYDEIINEIDDKHSKYISSAVSRARFLLINSNSLEDKLKKILDTIAIEFNNEDNVNLNDESSEMLLNVFSIFPQRYIDSDSLYSPPISKQIGEIEELSDDFDIDIEYIKEEKRLIENKLSSRFSRKNINNFVNHSLGSANRVLASTLEIRSKRDLIRLIFVNLYGEYANNSYHIEKKDELVEVNGFRFNDFEIVRGGTNGEF